MRIESTFGKLTVRATDVHLPYPYGRDTTGYEVANRTDTLAKAKEPGWPTTLRQVLPEREAI
jgi:hypothetical protein